MKQPKNPITARLMRSEREWLRQAAIEISQNIKTELEQRGLTARTRVVEGSAAPRSFTWPTRNVRVIVWLHAWKYESTQFRLGGTAERELPNTPRQSVFLARSSEQSAVGTDCALQRILVLLDGSQAAEAALVSR
ncbi:MAG: hypothetical protein R3C68_18160 [Myxococcota bacterium]